MGDMLEISACPHCGGAADIHQNYSAKSKSYFVFVHCRVCGAQGKIYGSKTDATTEEWANDACIDAIKAWNMRV